MNTTTPSTSFECTKLSPTTFLIIEDDAYLEHPQIIIKVYPDLLLICDTGCHAPRSSGLTITSLRNFLELYPVTSNANQPLNPRGKKHYLILCSHCHYDHILGLPQFLSASPTIVASSNDRSFITDDLPTTSLCEYMHVPTPQYTVSHWARHQEILLHPLSSASLRVMVLHTPGHTPDSLAWYDIDDHALYVGDTLYARERNSARGDLAEVVGMKRPELKMAIQFPREGNWIDYMASLDLLLSFARHQNEALKNLQDTGHPQSISDMTQSPRVLLSAGHQTAMVDAEHIILEVQELFENIISDTLKPVKTWEKRGMVYMSWLSKNEKFGVEAPRKLLLDMRKIRGLPCSPKDP